MEKITDQLTQKDSEDYSSKYSEIWFPDLDFIFHSEEIFNFSGPIDVLLLYICKGVKNKCHIFTY